MLIVLNVQLSLAQYTDIVVGVCGMDFQISVCQMDTAWNLVWFRFTDNHLWFRIKNENSDIVSSGQ